MPLSAFEQNLCNRNFTQDPPALGNQFEEDQTLQRCLQRYMPSEVYQKIRPDLSHFGELAVTEIAKEADLCERYLPQLTHVRPWGQHVDEIVVHEAWNRLHAISAREGLISIGYEREIGEFSRLHQFAKIYMFSAISIFSCPLAMTDGAARLVEVHGDEDLKKVAYSRLISRVPEVFSTSGQWMTERTGGSDVSNTSTVATKIDTSGEDPNTRQIIRKFSDSERLFAISGYKFFTSATTSGMAFTLARIQEDDKNMTLGNRGLSCFFIDVKSEEQPKPFYHQFSNPENPQRTHPSIRVHRLKDKLGTRAVPTAELELNNTPGYLVGQKAKGISIISEMFNITRIHNAISSCSLLSRGLSLAKDFSRKRFAFGKLIINHPLHVKTMAVTQADYEACTHVTFYTIALLGKKECGKLDTKQTGVLRILMPLIKLYTAKAAVRGISETLECLGGVGYMEDSGMPRLFRDAQVLPIWEGTTNVLSLDVFRVLNRTPQVLGYLFEEITSRLTRTRQSDNFTPAVKEACNKVNHVMQCAQTLFHSITPKTPTENVELTARDFSYALITSFCGALLLEEIVLSSHPETAADVAILFIKEFVSYVSPSLPTNLDADMYKRIVFGSRL